MRLNHDKGQNTATLYTHTHTQVIPEKTRATEGGRSMTEMLGVLAIIGVLSIGSIWAFSGVMNRFRANDLLEEASARAMRISEQIKKGRKTLSLGKFLHNETMGGTFSKQVFTSGLYQQFAIQVSDVNKSVCERVLNSITENTPLRRLSLATSPTTPITECQDDNAFLMVYNSGIKGKNKDKKYCESDKDCDTVCGECNENHICRNECEIPRPDLNSDFGQECGENECIVYDEETQSCKYACQRVEYLESTGTQWIDTEITLPSIVPSFKLKLSSKEYHSAYYLPLYVGVFNDGSRSFGIWKPSNSQMSIVDYNRNISTIDIDPTREWNEVIYNKNDKTFTVDGITVPTEVRGWWNGNPTNFALFASKTYNKPSAKISKVSIAYCQLFDGENLIKNFIPVIAPDGEPCMFDKVSQKLFCNEGTGTFKTNLDE